MVEKLVKSFILIALLSTQLFAVRNVVILDTKRGSGANSTDVRVFNEKFVKAVKSMDALFEVYDKIKLDKAAQAMGGCSNDECFFRVAKENGIALVITAQLSKVRDDFSAYFSVYDTDFGDNVFEYSDKLPGVVKNVSNSWMKNFVSQLEPLGYVAEEVDQGEVDEAVKATVILDDQLSGRLTRDKSPYLLVRSVVVPAGNVLEIDAGVTILIGGRNTSIVAYGQIFVNGTASSPVTFRSSRKEPKAWDWDRIYIRGNARSYFNHSRVMHSNFGLCVENGNLMVSGCVFEKNSITAMYFRQADVRIEKTDIGKGHIMGIHIDAGSKVSVDSGSIKGCSRAIVCQAYGSASLTGTRIENNDYGIAVDGRALVELVDALVTDNRVGIMSDAEIQKTRLLTIRGNDENMRHGSRKDLQGLFARPEMLTAVKVRERALAIDTATFAGGFKATISRGESFAARYGLLGQISGGLAYRRVSDLNSEVHRGTTADEMPHQTTYISGLRPEMQIFMQSKVGDREMDLTFNAYGNYNSPRLQPLSGEPSGEANLKNLEAYRNIQKIELLTLTTTLPSVSFVVGDFTENLSELSISSRQIRGLRLRKDIAIGEEKKLKTNVSFGQSGIPWPKGLKPDMLDSNTTPTRQEWLGMASVSGVAKGNVDFGVNVVTTRHVDNPVLFPGVSFSKNDLYGADPKIGALSWGVTAAKSLNRFLMASIEFAAGYGDTLSVDVDSANGEPAYSKDTTIHHPIDEQNLAGSIAFSYDIGGYSGVLEYTRAENQFYTGGNPSMKPMVGAIQKAKFTLGKTLEPEALKELIPTVDLAFGLDWEGVKSEESGIKVDTAGQDKFDVSGMQESDKLALLALYSNPDFTYQPHENRFRGNLVIRIPVSVFSVEPEISYYLENRTLYKRDTVSELQTLVVNRVEKSVMASPYTDAESRLQAGLGVLWAPGFGTELISNIRLKINLEGIFISDDNDGDIDPAKWSKNDGSQKRIKGSLSTRLWKRLVNNRLEISYKKKEKKELDEQKATVSILDKIGYDIIPRKLQLNFNGYYNKDITDYVEDGLAVNQVLKVYGVETEFKYSVSSNFSAILKGGYEYGFDNSNSGSENYKTYFGGLSGNYLF